MALAGNRTVALMAPITDGVSMSGQSRSSIGLLIPSLAATARAASVQGSPIGSPERRLRRSTRNRPPASRTHMASSPASHSLRIQGKQSSTLSLTLNGAGATGIAISAEGAMGTTAASGLAGTAEKVGDAIVAG